MWGYRGADSEELKTLKKYYNRLFYKAQNLEANIKRASCEEFDALMNQLEQVQDEMHEVARDIFITEYRESNNRSL